MSPCCAASVERNRPETVFLNISPFVSDWRGASHSHCSHEEVHRLPVHRHSESHFNTFTALLFLYLFTAIFLTPLVLRPQPLQIKSVVAPDHVKGYIYVESYKQTHVKSAIEGIGNLRMGLWNQQMVPIKEMTDVLKVVKEVTNLKPKSWVRLKRGLYKDDIAQVRTRGAGERARAGERERLGERVGESAGWRKRERR